MKNRLKDLIEDTLQEWECDVSDKTIEQISEHLVENGVIVPSNKPLPLIDEGDRVLCPICETDLMGCYFGYEEHPTVITCYGCGAWIDSTKAVDREEAEEAVERSENGT